jgi:hypothetical protein
VTPQEIDAFETQQARRLLEEIHSAFVCCVKDKVTVSAYFNLEKWWAEAHSLLKGLWRKDLEGRNTK